MKKLYSLLTALLIIYSVQAQELVPTWAHTAGGSDNDHGAGVAVDHKGSVYVIGNFKSASVTLGSTTLTNQGNWDAFLAKYDTSGALIWVQHIASAGKDTASKVLASSDGSIYVAYVKDSTFLNSSGQPSVTSVSRLLKFNSSGGVVWDRRDIGTRQLDIDPNGNLYALVNTAAPVAFRKYSPNGDELFTREITSAGVGESPMSVGDVLLSVDRQGQVHLLVYSQTRTNLKTNPANNLGLSVEYATRIWYNATGGLMGAETLTAGIRQVLPYFKAKGTNELVFTYWFPLLTELSHFSWTSKGGLGAVGGRINQPCFIIPNSKSADFDRMGAAYFGETYKSPDPLCHSTLTFPESVGTDMVFIRNTSLESYQYSTNIHGNTDERNVTIAVDTMGKSLYAVGAWSKIKDTSHFRFGNADLTNPGATGTNDFLFLKFQIKNAPLKAKAGFDKRTCPGGYTNLEGSAQGGAGGYSYSWSPAVGLSSATVPNPTVTPDSTREYILTVTDIEGGIAHDTVLVTVDSNFFRPRITLVSGTNPFCEGGSITLQATDGTNYVWSNGETSNYTIVRKTDTLTVTANGPQGCVGTSRPYVAVMTPNPRPTISPAGYIVNMCQGSPITLTAAHPDPTARFTWSPGGATTASITVTTPGVYSVRARVDGNSCISEAGEVRVQANLPATATISAGGNTTFCEGDSVKLTVTTATGNTILWSNGATTQSIWVKTSGTYSAQVSSPGCTATTTNSIAVTVKPKPAKPIISASGNTTFCAGGSVTLTASTNISGVSWLWSNGATTPSITVNASETYSVTASVDGCSSTSAPTTVTVNPLPNANISAYNPTTFCEGGYVRLDANTPTWNTVLWSNGATTRSITINSIPESGTYSAQITTPAGCTMTTNSIAVTVKPNPPAPTVTASGSTTFCAGGSVTLTASSTMNGATWRWNTGATTPSITVNNAGAYNVSATVNGCMSVPSGRTNVTVNPMPTGSISASGSTTFCEGGSVQLSVSTAPGNTVLWSNGATTSSITANASGTYSAQVTSPAGCTVTTNSINVTVKPKPATPTVSASGGTTFCSGGDVTLTASTSTGGVSWQWSNGATTPSITVNASGTYTVTATADGCSSTSSGTAVTVNPAPAGSISASGNTIFCEGGNVQLSVSTASGNSILWSNGATTSSITVNTSGTYSAQVTSPGGCTITTNSIMVTAKPKPVTPVVSTSGNTTFCSGGSVTLTASTSTGGVSWQWSNGATTPSITVNASGTYTATASINGCSSTSSGTAVTVNPAPAGSISASGNTTFCEGGNVQLSVSTAPGNSILWSNGATTSSITVNTSGTYSAQITSPAGCTITTNSITVTVKPKPATPTVSASGNTTFCSGGNVTLTASTSTSGVSWQWSNGATTSSITVNASGTYTATASINGCSSTSASTTVTVNPAPAGSISASGSTSFCEGDSVQLSVSTAPGNSILWSNGATTQSIWVKTGGTYSVQLTSAQGCTATTNSISTSVLQRPSPAIGQNGNELTVSPAAASYQWYLNGSAISGATSQTITISQGGDYSVVVTGSNGCTATAYHSAVFRVNTSFIAYQAYPNPVTADLRLAYTLKEGGQVTFTIMDDQGRQKMVIPVGNQAPGDHQYTIRNAAMRLGTGFYLLKITVGDKQVVHRIVVL
jgi:hypothetical protein